jgi:acyl-CoA synthetase (AMP-forming)/AMP-acid ligase II
MNVARIRTAFPAARTDRILAAEPFFHAVALIGVACRALFAGAALVILPGFDGDGGLLLAGQVTVTY